jgi:hypothetical protein
MAADMSLPEMSAGHGHRCVHLGALYIQLHVQNSSCASLRFGRSASQSRAAYLSWSNSLPFSRSFPRIPSSIAAVQLPISVFQSHFFRKETRSPTFVDLGLLAVQASSCTYSARHAGFHTWLPFFGGTWLATLNAIELPIPADVSPSVLELPRPGLGCDIDRRKSVFRLTKKSRRSDAKMS